MDPNTKIYKKCKISPPSFDERRSSREAKPALNEQKSKKGRNFTQQQWRKILPFENNKQKRGGEWCELRYERQTPKDSSFLSLLSHTQKHSPEWAMVSTGNPFFSYQTRKFIVIFFAYYTQLTTNWDVFIQRTWFSPPLKSHYAYVSISVMCDDMTTPKQWTPTSLTTVSFFLMKD